MFPVSNSRFIMQVVGCGSVGVREMKQFIRQYKVLFALSSTVTRMYQFPRTSEVS